jgi:hypothetical protein
MFTRRISILFALLDVSYLLTYCFHVPAMLNSAWHGQRESGAILLMYLLLLISAYAFLCERSWRFWFSYVFFPCRIAFGLLSFSWLATLILACSPSHPRLSEMVWLSAATLEGVRLGITLMLHRMQATDDACSTDTAVLKPVP